MRGGLRQFGIARAVLIAQLAIGGLYFVLIRPAYAQSQDVINDRVARQGLDIEALKDVNADARIRVLEENMVEVKWLGRSVAAAVIGQLLMIGLDKAKKRA